MTVSVGTAPTKFLAKLCSEEKKPDGSFVLRKNKEEIYKFLDQKKVRKIPGVGSQTEHILESLGIHKTFDLRQNLYKL